jgi:hypothetical protein
MACEIALFWGLEGHFCHEKRSSKKWQFKPSKLAFWGMISYDSQ